MSAFYLRVWRRDAPERVREIKIEGDTFMVGRGWDNQVRVDEEGVSRHHAQIHVDDQRVTLVDNGSTNGTWVRGERIQSCRLEVGDSFSIGEAIIELSDCSFSTGTVPKLCVDPPVTQRKPPPDARAQEAAAFRIRWRPAGDTNGPWNETPIRRSPFRIGRDSECSDLTLPDQKVSRAHAGIERDAGGFAIVDYQSSNGVFVNGAKISRTRISPGDRLQIGLFELIFDTVGLTDRASEQRPKTPQSLPEAPPPLPPRPPATPLPVPHGAQGAAVQGVEPEIACPLCATKLPAFALFCGSCGGELSRPRAGRENNDCSACGAKVDPRERYCGSCGRALTRGTVGPA
ncbi:MAG: FHA domain-containing protein [Acidobacteria bacterium]|nr:FHA domain-containing protein [Acidobacteriota bacterium]